MCRWIDALWRNAYLSIALLSTAISKCIFSELQEHQLSEGELPATYQQCSTSYLIALYTESLLRWAEKRLQDERRRVDLSTPFDVRTMISAIVQRILKNLPKSPAANANSLLIKVEILLQGSLGHDPLSHVYIPVARLCHPLGHI